MIACAPFADLGPLTAGDWINAAAILGIGLVLAWLAHELLFSDDAPETATDAAATDLLG